MRIVRELVGKTLLALVVVAVPLGAYAAEPVSSIMADDALSLLMEGNAFYSRGSLGNLVGNSLPKIRKTLAVWPGQHPYAVILSCSDSRVPPEIIFDKGLGEVFPIRVAGNVLASHQLGSIQYALEHLGSRLIVVLGHERCGAVTAAVTCANTPDCSADPINFYEPSAIGSIVESLLPTVQDADVEASVVANVSAMVDVLDNDPVVEEFRAKGNVIKVVGAKYDLDTGVVTWLLP